MIIIGIAQLMITLDNSIVTIALPSAQQELGFDVSLRSWIVSSYALTFGSLLLVAGRLLHVIGQRRVFVLSLVGFSLASVVGGLASGGAALVLARVLQGVFAAFLAPATMSLLLTHYPQEDMRRRAFGVFAALSISGAAIGMILGGALTELLNWRWCMFVNVIFALIALMGSRTFQSEQRRSMGRFDTWGTLTAIVGLFSFVLSLSVAETDGWQAPTVLSGLAVFVVLILLFWRIETRTATPLLPPYVVLNRTRGPAFLAIFFATVSLFGVFLFLTFVMQQSLGFSPFTTGLGFLPLVGAIMLSATQTTARLLPIMAPRQIIPVGLLIASCALFWLSRMGADPSYLQNIAAPLVVMGIGTGAVISTSMTTATKGIAPEDTGTAGATVNTMTQIGGAAGAAFLSSVAGIGEALDPIAGYATGFQVATLLSLIAAVICALAFERVIEQNADCL